jgi:hypothetical protein
VRVPVFSGRGLTRPYPIALSQYQSRYRTAGHREPFAKPRGRSTGCFCQCRPKTHESRATPRDVRNSPTGRRHHTRSVCRVLSCRFRGTGQPLKSLTPHPKPNGVVFPSFKFCGVHISRTVLEGRTRPEAVARIKRRKFSAEAIKASRRVLVTSVVKASVRYLSAFVDAIPTNTEGNCL